METSEGPAQSPNPPLYHAGFLVESTRDGSPTLRQVQSAGDFPGESMHHSGGALAETLYVYGPIWQWAFAQTRQAGFFSLGLGLGYHELLWAVLDLTMGGESQLWTSETHQGLIDEFTVWAQCAKKTAVFEDITQRVLASSWQKLLPTPIHKLREISVLDLQNHLHLASKEGRWQILPALSSLSLRDWKQTKPFVVQGILYDAFSRKTSPELWSEEFLREFLQTVAAPEAAFATYACLAPLKNALRAEGFALQVRPGFLGKRNSSLAIRQTR